MMHRLCVSHPQMTVEIGVDEEGQVVETPPGYVEKFLGQPMQNIFRWLEASGPGLEVKEL